MRKYPKAIGLSVLNSKFRPRRGNHGFKTSSSLFCLTLDGLKHCVRGKTYVNDNLERKESSSYERGALSPPILSHALHHIKSSLSNERSASVTSLISKAFQLIKMASISPETTLDAQHLLYLSGVNEVSFEHHGNDFSKTDPWYHQMENLDQYAFDSDTKNDTEHHPAISEQLHQEQESYPGSNSTNTELLDPPKPARTAMMCFALSKSNDRDESKVSTVDYAHADNIRFI